MQQQDCCSNIDQVSHKSVHSKTQPKSYLLNHEATGCAWTWKVRDQLLSYG